MPTTVVRFEADADDLTDALQRIGTVAEDTSDKIGKTKKQSNQAGFSFGNYAKVLVATKIALEAAGKAISAFTQAMAGNALELADMSRQTGIATDTLAALRLAAKSSGRQLQDLEGLLRKVTAEGLNIEDVAAQIQSLETPTQRAQKAMELLGEEGAVLAQVLGDRNFSAFQDFIGTFGEDTGPAAAEAAEKMRARLEESKTIMEELLTGPAGRLQEWLAGLAEDFNRTAIFVAGFAEALTTTTFAEFDAIMARTNERISAYNRLVYEAAQGTRELQGASGDSVAAIEASAEAQKKAAEANAAFLRELEKIKFKQTADDVLDLEAAYTVMADAFAGVEIRQSVFAINELAKATEEAGLTFDETVAKAKRLQAIQDFGAAASDGLASVAAGGQAVSMVATQIGDAFEAFGAKSEKAARAAFAANKAAGIADAVVKTAQGIMNAFATLPTPVALGVAPFVAATGAAQIATIAATTFEGGGTAGGGAGLGSGASGALDSSTSATGATVPGVTKGFQEDVTGTRMTRGGMTYRHRDLDVVARDGRRYPGGAFDAGGGTGQTRYDS